MLQRKAVVLGFTGALIFAASAQAADPAWSVLRGSAYEGEPVAPRPRFQPEWPVYRRWQGFYVGGQIGRNWINADFSNATKSQISYILANTELQNEVSGWTTLPRGSTGGMTYGGFIGYNAQWADAITGLELNYHHVGLDMKAQDSVGPILVAGANGADGSTVQYSVTTASRAAVSIHDIVTARARFAWAAERWLPYVFAGVAAATAETSSVAALSVFKAITPPPTTDAFGNSIPQPQGPFNPVTLPRNPQSQTRNTIAYGYTVGVGFDFAVTSNIFVRAEWEYVQFSAINDVRVSMNSGHLGVGVKF